MTVLLRAIEISMLIFKLGELHRLRINPEIWLNYSANFPEKSNILKEGFFTLVMLAQGLNST